MLRRLFALSGFKIALFITVVICVYFMMNALSGEPSFLNLLDKKWVDFIVKGRDTQPHTDNVVIATIDTKSVDNYGRWPWSRSRMAEMVEALNDHYKVSTIGFDIVFSEPVQDSGMAVTDEYKNLFASLGLPRNTKTNRFLTHLERTKANLDGDGQFGTSLKKTPNGILGYFFFSSEQNVKHLEQKEIEDSERRIAGSEISLLKGTINRGTIPIGLVPESNIDPIYKGGTLSGFFNMVPDAEDGTVRRVHLLMQHGENIYPNLDLQVLRHYYGADNIIVEADDDGYVSGIELGTKYIKTNLDGSVLLNYKGPQATFPHYSIFDIINRTVPKEKLEDKIVLIGATEVGVFDLRNTPVAVNFPGVEVHATLLDNVITDSYFQLGLMNDFYTFLLIIVFGLILGFTVPHLKNLYGSGLALVLLIGYTFAHRWMVNNILTWTSLIYPALTIIFIWAGITLYRFLTTDKDKRFIKSAFQQYLSPEVINQLMDNPQLLQLGGERRVMTAFFSDVQSFSSISEKLTPEQLVQLLNVYLTDMSNIIMEYGGTVDKYEGDAIIAFFGAPVAYEDHAIRACHVSLDCHKRLAELNDEWYESGLYKTWEEAVGPRLKHRIGLNTGEMVVGNMGSVDRFDYTMMGNAVNLAARLEGANKNYGMFNCISEYTYEPAKEVVEAREMDLIRVMGIKQPVRIYELVARKGELSEEHTKAFAYFAKGLELYRDQQWDEAAKYFNAVNKFIPDDPPSAKYIERCRNMKANPPATDWDGVFEATSK